MPCSDSVGRLQRTGKKQNVGMSMCAEESQAKLIVRRDCGCDLSACAVYWKHPMGAEKNEPSPLFVLVQ